jgi:hypothetical protein
MNPKGMDLNPIKVQTPDRMLVSSQRIWILVRATPCGTLGCVSSRCTCIWRLGASWVESFRGFAAALDVHRTETDSASSFF